MKNIFQLNNNLIKTFQLKAWFEKLMNFTQLCDEMTI